MKTVVDPGYLVLYIPVHCTELLESLMIILYPQYPVRMKLPQVQQSASAAASGDTTSSMQQHSAEMSTLKVIDIAAGRDHTLLLGE